MILTNINDKTVAEKFSSQKCGMFHVFTIGEGKGGHEFIFTKNHGHSHRIPLLNLPVGTFNLASRKFMEPHYSSGIS